MTGQGKSIMMGLVRHKGEGTRRGGAGPGDKEKESPGPGKEKDNVLGP